MADSISIIEGTVKFRDGKKWKSRWCVMRKLSPVADCLHLQLYKDSKDRQKNGQTKASLSLQKYLGFESGFTLDKESNTIAILCEDVVPVLAFDTREILMQWRVKVSHNLGASREFSAMCMSAPSRGPLRAGPLRLHARAARLSAAAGAPPALLAVWEVAHLRRFGMVEGRFCMEGGSRCGRAGGAFVFGVERGRDLVQVLDQAATTGGGHAGSRLSLASRAGSSIDKRLSDASSCADDTCCHASQRSVSPTWHAAADHNTTDLDSSACSDAPVRPTTLLRCSSCIGKFGPTRSAATTPGAISALSPAWIMDSLSEKRSECDRVSIYSRSSGSMSEYSVPRSIGASANYLDKSFERASPIACCTPTVPIKTGSTCQCWQQQTKTCSCARKKLFTGPYENYDIPKTPMPLIHEHPADSQNSSDASSYYDTPKKFLKCLAETNCECKCQTDGFKIETDESKMNSSSSSQLENGDESFTIESHSNYVNMDPIKEPIEITEDYGNYANGDLSVTLEEFETSSQILRSAGFSQEEIDALDDIPENEDVESEIEINMYAAPDSINTHENYVHMEPLGKLGDENGNNQISDTLSQISEPSPKTYDDLSSTIRRRSSSADFMKRAEDFIDIYKSNSHRDVTINLNGLRKSVKNECINDNCEHCIRTHVCTEGESGDKSEFKVPETKNESSFLAKFRDSVKIRRSSSVPSKTEKNRDSSSSNDSGVSTGSLKHHRCDFSEFELPITNSKSCKKHIKSSNKPCRKTQKAHYAHSAHSMFVKSNSSDPLKNITFQFDEVATLTKAMSCDVDTLTRRHKPRGCASLDGSHARDSQITTRSSQSTSSGASDMSDYLESLSLSSFSSCDVTSSHVHPTHRSVLRPRSGNQYLTMERVRSCTNNPNN